MSMETTTEQNRAQFDDHHGHSHEPQGGESSKMKRSLPSLVTGILLVSILLLYMVTYQVRFTEVAVVRTFGQVNKETGVKKEPGLYWKWPWPIQKVDHYDNRLQVTSTIGEENPTKDGKNIIVTTAINWRIDDPYMFCIRCVDIPDAESKLKSRVRNDQKTVIGKYNFSQFISTNPQELQYDTIAEEIKKTVEASAKELYGAKVESVKLESIALPQRITENVFEAMKKERAAVAARYTSEGESTAQQIKDTAEGIAGTIRSFADRQAAEIVAEGQRRAADYNKVFAQDQELASFLILIRNLPQILKDRTTLVLDAGSAGFTPLISDNATQVAGPAPASQPARVEAPANGGPSGDPLPGMIQQR
jgi:membrane protease subunit HflC